MLKQARSTVDDFDSQALTPALPHQQGFELTALYTLQPSLPRNAELARRFQHRHVLGPRLRHDASPQRLGDANLPGRAGSDLLAGDEPIGQPAVNTGGIHAEDLRCLSDGHQLPAGRLRWWLEPRNASVAA